MHLSMSKQRLGTLRLWILLPCLKGKGVCVCVCMGMWMVGGGRGGGVGQLLFIVQGKRIQPGETIPVHSGGR